MDYLTILALSAAAARTNKHTRRQECRQVGPPVLYRMSLISLSWFAYACSSRLQQAQANSPAGNNTVKWTHPYCTTSLRCHLTRAAKTFNEGSSVIESQSTLSQIHTPSCFCAFAPHGLKSIEISQFWQLWNWCTDQPIPTLLVLPHMQPCSVRWNQISMKLKTFF